MKIKKLEEEVRIDHEVYNGNKKVNADKFEFMDSPSIKHCLLSLKNKNLEVMDRIPQRILLDGAELLVMLLAGLLISYNMIKVFLTSA